MAECRRYIAGVWAITLCLLSSDAFSRPMMLQIEQGETAFIVNSETETAFWILDDCKRSLKVETSDNSKTTMQSQVLHDNVQIGSRQVELKQQFRFNLASVPASVEVYNSVRGGWSSVPVQVEPTCHLSANCRQRMELPECPSG